MVDRLTPEQRPLKMRRVRAKTTKSETIVRRLLQAQGLRFRLHRTDLPGGHDIVLSRHRAAVFVHGCFWHRHSCALLRMPTTRANFWIPKIAGNQRRDRAALEGLGGISWRILWVWECALCGKNCLTGPELDDALEAFIRSEIGFAKIGEKGMAGV